MINNILYIIIEKTELIICLKIAYRFRTTTIALYIVIQLKHAQVYIARSPQHLISYIRAVY